MRYELQEDKFHVRAYFASCACSCKFCCLGDYPKNRTISFDDYEMVMRKFASIQDSHGMRLRSFIYNCVEHPYLERQIALYKELGLPSNEFTQLDLNGTRIRSKDEIKKWFDYLQNAGMERVAFSWFGLEEMHDRFVNRKGYFQYLTDCADEASNRNISVISKVFLHKEIAADLGKLLLKLKSRGDTVICAFMEYSGKAKDLANDFVTKQDFDALYAIAKPYISGKYLYKFKTEREWIQLAIDNKFPEFKIVDYILYLDSSNIEHIKQASVEDIIQYYRKMDMDFQASFESVKNLALKYGDNSCEILYECRDVLRKWLDLYYMDNKLNQENLFSFTNNSVEWKVYERL